MVDSYFLSHGINKATPIPLYYQIKEILLGYIKSSEAGKPIPTEDELCKLYDVSRPTIRQALRELEMSNLIYRQKAKGSFVGESKVEQELLIHFESFEERMKRHDKQVRTEILEFETVDADENVIRKLKLDNNTRVYKLRTISYADDVPMVLSLSFLPVKDFSGLTREDFEQHSVQELIRQKYQIREERKTFEVKPASEFEVQLFGGHKNDFVQYLETISYMADQVPLQYTMERYRSDRTKFIIKFTYPEE